MPLYDYTCSTCSHSFEKRLPISEYEIPTHEPCPNCQSQTVIKDVCAPALGDSVRLGITRPDAGWNEVLSKVKQAHPNGNWSNKRASPRAGR